MRKGEIMVVDEQDVRACQRRTRTRSQQARLCSLIGGLAVAALIGCGTDRVDPALDDGGYRDRGAAMDGSTGGTDARAGRRDGQAAVGDLGPSHRDTSGVRSDTYRAPAPDTYRAPAPDTYRPPARDSSAVYDASAVPDAARACGPWSGPGTNFKYWKCSRTCGAAQQTIYCAFYSCTCSRDGKIVGTCQNLQLNRDCSKAAACCGL